MKFKKAGKKVFGCAMTSKEKQAMQAEIMKELAEFNRKNQMEIDACILWQLHVIFGFGPDRLKRFYDGFIKEFEEIQSRYEMNDSDNAWLCTQKLKEYGIDIEEWHKDGEEK